MGGLRLLKPAKTKRKYHKTMYSVNKPTKYLFNNCQGRIETIKKSVKISSDCCLMLNEQF